jgi:hypothetical protein
VKENAAVEKAVLVRRAIAQGGQRRIVSHPRTPLDHRYRGVRKLDLSFCASAYRRHCRKQCTFSPGTILSAQTLF